MTDMETAPTLTEVLVRYAIYSHNGIYRIAIDDFTLQDLTGDNTFRVALSDVALAEQPGCPEWVDRMVRIRRSLVRSNTDLQNQRESLLQWKQGLGEALLEEADRRGWCDEYNTFAEEWDLPKRITEWEVTMTVKVSARTEHDAIAVVQDSTSIQPDYTENVVSVPTFEASEA